MAANNLANRRQTLSISNWLTRFEGRALLKASWLQKHIQITSNYNALHRAAFVVQDLLTEKKEIYQAQLCRYQLTPTRDTQRNVKGKEPKRSELV